MWLERKKLNATLVKTFRNLIQSTLTILPFPLICKTKFKNDIVQNEKSEKNNHLCFKTRVTIRSLIEYYLRVYFMNHTRTEEVEGDFYFGIYAFIEHHVCEILITMYVVIWHVPRVHIVEHCTAAVANIMVSRQSFLFRFFSFCFLLVRNPVS